MEVGKDLRPLHALRTATTNHANMMASRYDEVDGAAGFQAALGESLNAPNAASAPAGGRSGGWAGEGSPNASRIDKSSVAHLHELVTEREGKATIDVMMEVTRDDVDGVVSRKGVGERARVAGGNEPKFGEIGMEFWVRGGWYFFLFFFCFALSRTRARTRSFPGARAPSLHLYLFLALPLCICLPLLPPSCLSFPLCLSLSLSLFVSRARALSLSLSHAITPSLSLSLSLSISHSLYSWFSYLFLSGGRAHEVRNARQCTSPGS